MIGKPEVRKSGKSWAVVVADHDGEVREFRYRYESQARYFAAIFALNPRMLPNVGTLSVRRRAQAKVEGSARA